MIDPFTGMTIVAGSLAGMATFATAGWSYNLKWKRYWAKEAEEAQGQALKALDQRDAATALADRLQSQIDQSCTNFIALSDLQTATLGLLVASRARATDLEDRLRKIEQARHASAKHARAAQIAQRKALRDATTAEVARTTKRVDAADDLQEAA